MFPKLTHICLHVERLDDCARFYQRYCNLDVIYEQTKQGEGSVYLSARGHETGIVLQLKSGGRNLVLADNDERHFGFELESKQAVDNIANRAREDGVLFFEPDEYLPGAYFCGVSDPNGNCLEFSYGPPVPPV